MFCSDTDYQIMFLRQLTRYPCRNLYSSSSLNPKTNFKRLEYQASLYVKYNYSSSRIGWGRVPSPHKKKTHKEALPNQSYNMQPKTKLADKSFSVIGFRALPKSVKRNVVIQIAFIGATVVYIYGFGLYMTDKAFRVRGSRLPRLLTFCNFTQRYNECEPYKKVIAVLSSSEDVRTLVGGNRKEDTNESGSFSLLETDGFIRGENTVAHLPSQASFALKKRNGDTVGDIEVQYQTKVNQKKEEVISWLEINCGNLRKIFYLDDNGKLIEETGWLHQTFDKNQPETPAFNIDLNELDVESYAVGSQYTTEIKYASKAVDVAFAIIVVGIVVFTIARRFKSLPVLAKFIKNVSYERKVHLCSTTSKIVDLAENRMVHHPQVVKEFGTEIAFSTRMERGATITDQKVKFSLWFEGVPSDLGHANPNGLLSVESSCVDGQWGLDDLKLKCEDGRIINI